LAADAKLNTCLQILALVYTVVFSALHYSILCSRDKINFRTALARVPEAAVSFLLGLILLGPIVALLGYHLRVSQISTFRYDNVPDTPRFNVANGNQCHDGGAGTS
jgi:hypothetical protein